jgi:ribosomal protein S27E
VKYLRPYYVPVVAKSKDYLVGYLDALQIISTFADVDPSILDSTQFTDILPNGVRRRDLEEQEIKDILEELDERKNIKENDTGEEEERPYFEVNCVCGNYHSFSDGFEIPDETMKCEICGKILIDYTGHEPLEYEYDGDLEKMFISHKEESEEDDEDE